MKIAVECKSLLLQKALENFLGRHLSSIKHSEIVVRDFQSDDKRTFLIASDEGADLKKPFSKSQLLLALQNRHKSLKGDETKDTFEGKKLTQKERDFEQLRQRIETLTQEYQNKVLETVKAFYG